MVMSLSALGNNEAAIKEREFVGNALAHFELLAADASKLTSFYTQLFEWETNDDNIVGYPVTNTGCVNISGGFSGTTSPPATVLYFQSANMHNDLARAEASGARTVASVTSIEGVKFARFLDPYGHTIGLWEVGTELFPAKPELRNPIVGFELSGHDLLHVASFYKNVFSWDINVIEGWINTGGQGVTGRIVEERGAELRLSVVVHSDDLDATTAKVLELGGKVADDKTINGSSWKDGEAVVRFNDPHGNIFAVTTSKSQVDFC